MVSSNYDPLCTRCGHLRSLHKHVERPDIWWCSGNGMGAGRCICPVFSDAVTEHFEPDEVDEVVETPFEMPFVFVKRGESIMWTKEPTLYLTVPSRSVELMPAQATDGCISLHRSAEIHDCRLDCVIDDGALSGRRAAWVALLAGLRLHPTIYNAVPVIEGGITFAQGDLCDGCNKARLDHDHAHDDVDADRMFHAYDTLPEGAVPWQIVPAKNLFHLEMHFDPGALKKDEEIPIGFLRVVVSGMLFDEDAVDVGS